MLKTYLAEYQSETLTDAGHSGVENTLSRQFETETMVLGGVAFGENRHSDAAQGDHHSEDGDGAHLFAKEKSSGERGRRCRKGHEELSEARPDVDVALHQAVVADDVADHAREQQPAPRASVCEARVGDAHHKPEGEDKETQRHRHPYRVEWQRAHAFRAHLRKKGGGSPGERDEEGNQFTEKHGVGLEQLNDFWEEDEQADGGGGDGVHQNGGGCQVFDLLDAIVAFGADHIGEVFDGGVEDLAAEDQPNGKGDGGPLQRRQFEQRARDDDADGREKMYPAVVFLLEEHLQPVECVGKAFQPLRN